MTTKRRRWLDRHIASITIRGIYMYIRIHGPCDEISFAIFGTICQNCIRLKRKLEMEKIDRLAQSV